MKYIYLVIQEQCIKAETITVNVRSQESIKRFSEMADPQLVPRNKLIDILANDNYILGKVYEKDVPNNKKMVGLVFSI